MIYRIVLKTPIGKLYYLVSDNDCPETDAEVDLENIQFLSNLNPTHAHSFSTVELAEKTKNSLPYPYDEKSSIIKFDAKDSPIISSIYYRIVKYSFEKILWLTVNKTFTPLVCEETISFYKLEDAKEYFKALNNLTKKVSCICEIHDFGEPDYNFEIHYMTADNKKTLEFPIKVNHSSKYL